MCVIYACYSGVPNNEELNAAEKANSHGAGIAWVEPDKSAVRWEKGLDVKEIKSLLKKVKPPLLLHFRIASEGPICDALTHPFPCTEDASLATSGSAPMVLCHNGTWTGWRYQTLDLVKYRKDLKVPEGPWSDSRAMAFLVGGFGPGVFNFMSSFDEKVAMLGAVPSPEGKHLRILALSKWFNEDKLGYLRSSAWPMAEKEKPISVGGYKSSQPVGVGVCGVKSGKDEDAKNADGESMSPTEASRFLASLVKARKCVVF